MKKKIKIIFIILLILLITILISLKFLSRNQEQISEEKTNQELRAEKVEEYFSDKVLPQGVSTLYGKYTGNNEKNDLYRSIAKMLNFLPNLVSDLSNSSNEKIADYFSKNETEIKQKLGILELEDFTNLVKYLNVYSINNDKYQYCSINSQSYKEEDGYLTFDLDIIYEDLEPITIKVYFANSKTQNPKVIFLSR